MRRVVKEQSVGGYIVKEQHFATCDTAQFMSWVLLEYDVENENKVLIDEINEEPDLAIELRRSKAFKELEEELN